MDNLTIETTTRKEVVAFLKKHRFEVFASDSHESLLAVAKLIGISFPFMRRRDNG